MAARDIVITGAEWVVFGVEDIDACRRFLDLYGLTETARSPDHSIWQALDGSGVELRRIDDPALPPPLVPGSTGRRYVWGVRDAASLDHIRDELSKDRAVSEADGVLTSIDDDGHVISFRITRRTTFEAPLATINVPGHPPGRPVNERVNFKEAGLARTMGHLVFWSTDPDRSFAFYRDRLGFKVTDSFERNGGIFARASGHADHHSIFFIHVGQSPFQPSLQHVEFQFADAQEVLVIGQRLSQAGFQTAFGPGRHELGSNWYWYFVAPMGAFFEVAADMDRVDDEWVPGVWGSVRDVQGWSLAFGAAGPSV